MAKCEMCGTEIERGRTCGPTCRQRLHRQSVTGESVTKQSVTPENVTLPVTHAIPGWAGPDCQCQHCRQNRINGSKHTINHGAYKWFGDLAAGELNRQALPGDPDYAGCALVRTS